MRNFFRSRAIIFGTIIIVLSAVFACASFFGMGGSEPPVNPANNQQNNMLKLTSPYFTHNDGFPSKYTCDGENVNPPLAIASVPVKAQSLALILRDPDAPSGAFIHWIVFNIDPKTEKIEADSVPDGAIQGAATGGKNHYVGPCPPSGTHRYIFTLYALDEKLMLNEGATVQQLETAMEGHIIEQTDLMAKYR